MSAAVDSYVVDGNNVYFDKTTPARSLVADSQSFTLTGVSATLNKTTVSGAPFTLTASAGTFSYTGVAAGLSSSVGFYVSTDAAYDALYSAELAAQGGSNIYVATTGNDTTGTGSSGAPYLTIGKAISVMAAGDQVIVKNGTYTGTSNWISTNQVAIPNGSAGAYTRIRAENRFGVRIVQSSSPAIYSDAPIKLGSKQYVWVDGFIVESTFTASTGDGNDDCVVDLSSAVHCRATRIIAKRKSCDQYGSSFQYGNGNVLEDCHHFGSSRYAYYGGTGGGSSAAGSTVLRRCVSFMPFGPVFEPTASFCFYGSNTSAYALCKDVLFANCYEIDSPHLPKKSGQNPEDLKWGAWYHPKSVRNIEHVGCGVINGGAEYGAFRTDNYGGASDVLATFTDCFVSGLQNGNGTATPGGFSKASNGLITCANYTVRDIPGAAVPASGSTNTLGLTSSIVYPTQRVGGNGANQTYAVGAFLSEYGSSGYKTVQTSMPLWPFPYETYLHGIWDETISRVTQDVPTGTATSGDPASGISLGGYPMTFTRRVWESAGNATPSFAAGGGIY